MISAVLTAWSWFRGSRVGQIAVAVVAGFLAVLGARAMWKRDGRIEAERDAMEGAFDQIEDARRARRDADRGNAGDGLREDDGYRRD